ncbi:hypothetical protein WICMUC_001802 [Wickerhamomyces mucosus]|uniref:GB1/RHD3-type G domain-containing protein n=1 Tax=Wickerhamomyces mucosus TaxID=1378264 RepID=A0A9P8TFQ8_9ASCO|nr:hypothetical protein WICMUC_001802 [Wickerhamomyces mucosus]
MSKDNLTNVSVQVIDENKVFQKDNINNYIKSVVDKDLALNYHVISVFGSQSTGKSTLLNTLFHTKFDVMNETQRQQTTKGIWLGFSPKIQSNITNNENIFVMDVEGSDGRERGEDQDFERKAALFALSTSQVLIINIWEHQVGLYQGANMGLLKTVFDVNLSLFGNTAHKVLLLFVIRDHIGNTPLENLADTLTQDLTKMWENITKPKNVDENVKLTDYFDLKFVTLSHKVLQPDQFQEDIKKLGDKFTKDDLLKIDYKQNFPVDGWTLYAENCWEQIQSNKDLDLPTQQTLVARFRCDEIVKESLELFKSEFDQIFESFDYNIDAVQLSEKFTKLSQLTLNSYDSQASHYNSLVYNSKRETLINDINFKLKSIYDLYLKNLKKSSIEKFNAIFQDKTNKSTFLEKSQSKDLISKEFEISLNQIFTTNEYFEYELELKEFKNDLDRELQNITLNEIKSVIIKFNKKISPLIKNQTLEILSIPDEEVWDRILNNFHEIVTNSLSNFKINDDEFDFKLGLSTQENKEIKIKLEKSAWISLDQFIHDYLNEDNVITILKHKFEESFQFDSNNVPRIWKNEQEISKSYKEASDFALHLLPLLSIAKTSNNIEIIPDYPLFEEQDDEDKEDNHRFAHILTAVQQNKIKTKFLKQIEINYRDASRSIITNVAKIPPFIYVLLILLGWNEFMAILRNPIYLILTIIFGTGAFFIHQLNLWGPVLSASNVLVDQGKSYLVDFLIPEHSRRSIAVDNSGSQIYEMDDLSEKKKD